MNDAESFDDDSPDWQRFVIDHGYGAAGSDLAAVLRRPIADIERIRATGACSRSRRRKNFAELFHVRHGREPRDDEWPPPRKQGGRGSYEWQGPELALLATLVGRLGKEEIAQVLTQRLRDVTGDPSAARNPVAVQVAINRIGMQSSDVVSGITTADAAREIGSLAMVNQAVHKGDIRAVRVGRLWVIPYEAWNAWKSKRIFPPAGYVALSKLKGPLAIRSDKLSEFARLGYVPTAIRCNPYGAGPSTQFGTWYVDGNVATRLVADRHAGRPMPWHGKPLTENLRSTYRLWQDRKHPATCKTCAAIWGGEGPPTDFEEYSRRYPPLAHGAKRHLTMIWSAGLCVRQVARQASCSEKHVRRAISNGALDATQDGDRTFVSRTAATRWISGGCSSGDLRRSWISLATARKRYLFTKRELEELVAQGKLKSRTGTDGAARGVVYVSSQQCVSLRNASGFTDREAARRARVPLERFRAVLEGLNWRKTGAIPLSTAQAAINRLKSHPGYSIDEAARELGRTTAWVEARVRDGTVRLLRRSWDDEHVYLSEPMMDRLRQAPASPTPPIATGSDWLRLGNAAREAGVTGGTIIRWAEHGELKRINTPMGWKYPREQVRARARRYWKEVRFHRARPPQWLGAEADD